MGVDYKDSALSAGDIANQALQGQLVSRAMKFALIQTATLANTIAHRELRKNAYPLAELSFKANRKVFRLEPGDLFKLSYTPYGISSMVFRVVEIHESNLESEEITVVAMEDADYLSSTDVTVPEGATGEAEAVTVDIDALTHVKIVEAPYVFGGDAIGIVPLAARETGMERGYALTMSLDGGTSYILVATINRFCPFGTLVADYTDDTYMLDRSVGFEIDFSNDDVDEILTIDTLLVYGSTNLALLGDEIISFRTITPDPVVAGRYAISYIYRGRFDTEKTAHTAGEEFYFLGPSNAAGVADEAILLNAAREFKAVPFTHYGSGLTADASAVSLTPSGRAMKPYPPSNLRSNSAGVHATYSTDIVLTWDPRVRGGGAGVGGYSSARYPASAAWEGYFRVLVYVGGVLKRTTESIDAATWTYTQAMNLSDNGALASTVVLRVYNYRTALDVEYCSTYASITVKKI